MLTIGFAILEVLLTAAGIFLLWRVLLAGQNATILRVLTFMALGLFMAVAIVLFLGIVCMRFS